MNVVKDRYGNDLKVKAFHVGEYLREEIEARGLIKKVVAEKIGILPTHLSEILNGKRSLSVKTAVKLEDVLDGISADYWLSLQMQFDIQETKQELALTE
ncbi:HigA family addiction module antitoxin [Sphingobacterium hungaricum]